MNIARSSAKLFAARFGSTILQFLAIVYFENAIGLSNLGVFFLFQAIIGISAIPADFGLRGAVEKRVSEGSDASRYIASVLLLKLVPLGVVSLFILFFSDSIASYVGADVAALLVVGLLLQEGSMLSISVLKGQLRVEETAALEIAQKLTWVLVGVLLVQFAFGVEALIYAHLLGSALVGVLGWIKISVSLGIPTKNHIESLLSYAKHNFISSIGGNIYNWADIIMIGYFLPGSYVAAYEIAWRITSFTIIYSKALSTALFPQISAWHSSKENEEIENKITELLALSPLVVVPAFFGVVLYSEEILTLVFSEEAAIASIALIVLMIDEITESIQTVVGRSLQAVNRPDLAARATVVAVLLNIVLNIVLIWQFGIVGAAIATTTASFVGGVILHAVYLNRIISLHFPWREWSECCLAAALMTGGLLAVNQILVINSVLQLFFAISVGIVLYFAFLYQSPSIRPLVEKQLEEYRNS